MILSFIQTHLAVIAVITQWLFSAAASTMPPLKDGAGFYATWIYKFIQAVSANFSKHDQPTGIAGPSTSAEPVKGK